MIRVVKDDITKVTEFDAIVNCANNSLLGGGGIDGLIHRAAGPQLRTECRRLNGCETGDSRLTYGYELPCDYIIHSVGPVWMGGTAGEKELLRSCYTSALELAAENKIRRLAFCSISTGELGYPVERAAKVAVATVCDYVKKNPDAFDDICWVVPDDLCLKSYSEEIKAAVPKKKPVKKAKAAEETVEEVEEVDEVAESEENSEEQAVKETAEEVEEQAAEESAPEMEEIEKADSEEVQKASETSSEEEEATEGKIEASENQAEDEAETTFNQDNLKYWNLYDINWLISEEEQGNSHRYVCFWHDTSGSDNSILSSWHAGKPITINGRTYATLEQYIISEQALLFGDFDSYKIIMEEPDPQKCKKAGRNIKNYDETKWRAAFKEIIFRGAYMRALCDEEFAGALLATGDDVLIEASPFDDIYGAGMKESELITPDGTLKVPPQQWRAYKSEKQSENILGFALMGVRKYLRKLLK
nr:macro domain-containing protein [Butyrivibrio sp. MB2005]